MKTQKFTVVAHAGPRGRLFVPVPFDPDQAWAPKPLHHVTGSINGMGIRAVLERHEDQWGLTLGPAAWRGCGIDADTKLTVILEPEGPQREDLAEDVAAALQANPKAGAFFDSLAQFYRKAYLSWIDATKRKPEQRAVRISEMIDLLQVGVKERPKG